MRGFTMTPSQRVRNGCEAARNARWRAAGGYFKVLLVTLNSGERKNKNKTLTRNNSHKWQKSPF